jgi:RNA polymerase sigma factor (TIGR02999 family)
MEPGAQFRDLIPLVYQELRRLAHAHLASERHAETLNTTALVHELWLRVGSSPDAGCERESQFFAYCAKLMRHILVDHARARLRAKRGGIARKVPLEGALLASEQRSRELVALHDALEALSRFDPRKAQVVELRYFGGFSVEETARALGISSESVHRDWKIARLWLTRELNDNLETPRR